MGERLSVGFLCTLVVGDINVHHTHWLTFSHTVSVEGSRFRQMIKQPTHIEGHLLDLGVVDMIEVESATVLPRVANHNVIRFVMNFEMPHQHPRGRRVYEYNQAPWHVTRADLAAQDWFRIRTSSVDDAAHRFNTEI